MAGPGETIYPDAKKVTARTQVRDVRTGEIFLGFVDFFSLLPHRPLSLILRPRFWAALSSFP